MQERIDLGKLIRPQTLTAATAARIREAILCGQLVPNTSLHEMELAASLNVSRGTVREALRLLREEGLVEVIPHRGAFVAELSPRRVYEIFTLRAMLEPNAVRLALERKGYSDQDLMYLEALVRRMGELEQQGDIIAVARTDMEFHHYLSKRSDHQLLLEVLSNLQTQTLLFIIHTKLYRSDLTSDEVSHRAIVAAVRNGHPATAEEVVRRHIIEAGTLLLGRMEGFRRSETPQLERDGSENNGLQEQNPIRS